MRSTKQYQEYERACATIRKQNVQLLKEFRNWLSEKGLAEKTILQHIENVDFYVNDFLLYYDAVPASEGAREISSCLGDWFIRKALWASPTSIRSIAASLKKFYTFMHERGRISAEDLQDVKDTIKDGLPVWLETLADFEDPDDPNPWARWGM